MQKRQSALSQQGTEQKRQRAFNLLATELSTRIRLLLTLLEKEKRASTLSISD